MAFPKAPIGKPIKSHHPVHTIHITSKEINSVVGTQGYYGHWLRGLCSTGDHRWKVTQREIVYGPEAPKENERHYATDEPANSPYAIRQQKDGVRLWNRLVQAVPLAHRQTEAATKAAA